MIDADEYFLWQGREEAKELKRNPTIDRDLLEPWGGNFKIKENTDASIQQHRTSNVDLQG